VGSSKGNASQNALDLKFHNKKQLLCERMSGKYLPAKSDSNLAGSDMHLSSCKDFNVEELKRGTTSVPLQLAF
jgi:hypothetical protein